jgi:hypothetical protein
VLAVHDSTTTVVRKTFNVAVLGHNNSTYELCIDDETDDGEFLRGLEVGDSIGVWAVSAPYPGKLLH